MRIGRWTADGCTTNPTLPMFRNGTFTTIDECAFTQLPNACLSGLVRRLRQLMRPAALRRLALVKTVLALKADYETISTASC
ncbi:unnamed protein product [Strongylus vulgaris]|uniref:Uncharacterized protein n=1 Tax=Strongylus vulgaris TaxID=40348 RepID=A0A3P7KFA6_STRVU|nr:unnamed protein product [Strongylus vulgaris]